MIKNKMKTKTFLSAFLALVAVFMFSMVSASIASTAVVTFNDVELTGSNVTMAGITGDSVPVRVVFTSDVDASDVKVKVWVDNGRTEYTDVTSRFNLVSGSTYSKVLTLQIPSDLDETNKALNVRVEVYNAESEFYLDSFTVQAQRESYNIGILSVDYDLFATAGDVVPVSVVLTNEGFEDSDNGFVTVAVPALGIMSKAYFNDLAAVENKSMEYKIDDSVQRILYLKIPSNAKSGVYDVVVRAYNADTSSTVTQSIKVDGSGNTQAANVTTSQGSSDDSNKTVSVSAIVLTVLLVIIFVVLLVALIVLLTRKDKQVEEVETSYY